MREAFSSVLGAFQGVTRRFKDVSEAGCLKEDLGGFTRSLRTFQGYLRGVKGSFRRLQDVSGELLGAFPAVTGRVQRHFRGFCRNSGACVTWGLRRF